MEIPRQGRQDKDYNERAAEKKRQAGNIFHTISVTRANAVLQGLSGFLKTTGKNPLLTYYPQYSRPFTRRKSRFVRWKNSLFKPFYCFLLSNCKKFGGNTPKYPRLPGHTSPIRTVCIKSNTASIFTLYYKQLINRITGTVRIEAELLRGGRILRQGFHLVFKLLEHQIGGSIGFFQFLKALVQAGIG
jgi:hypothetical protein